MAMILFWMGQFSKKYQSLTNVGPSDKIFVTYWFKMKLKRYFLPKNEFIETKEKKRLLKTHFEILALGCTETWIGPTHLHTIAYVDLHRLHRPT